MASVRVTHHGPLRAAVNSFWVSRNERSYLIKNHTNKGMVLIVLTTCFGGWQIPLVCSERCHSPLFYFLKHLTLLSWQAFRTRAHKPCVKNGSVLCINFLGSDQSRWYLFSWNCWTTTQGWLRFDGTDWFPGNIFRFSTPCWQHLSQKDAQPCFPSWHSIFVTVLIALLSNCALGTL